MTGMRHRSKGLAGMIVLVAAALAAAAPPSHDPAELAGRLLRQHPYLLEEPHRQAMDEELRKLREAVARREKASTDQARQKAAADREAATAALLAILEEVPAAIRVAAGEDGLEPAAGGRVTLPGNSGALLIRFERQAGDTQFSAVRQDLTAMPHEGATIEAPVVGAGATWVLIGLANVPDGRTSLTVRFAPPGGSAVAWPVDVVTPQKARLKVRILSDRDEPAPAMVRLTWRTGGETDLRPSNVVDFAPQFDSQGSVTSHRPTNLPGQMGGSYWCVPGPFDMNVSPGEYHIAVRRGIEHVPVSDTFTAAPGETVEKTYRIARWVDMPGLGWYSGDDHVHHSILNDADAKRLMTWVRAEDIHVANVVKMGDINRTWFEQRGFGREYRVIDGDHVLSPGQECPRTHDQLGHTISMNTTSMVRDSDRYYAYDWVADTVHAQGGLWGYAHVCFPMFFVHRDMSMNVPAGRVDFVELLQFAHLGTDLYYQFLNTGFKLTASAGSDVPWGGTVGEVRVYAHTGEEPFSADAWFKAFGSGRTFVTNGPMIDLRVEEALPGDEIAVAENRKLRVRARAWGDPGRMLPVRLEIVQHGDVIRAVTSEEQEKEVKLDFDLDSAHGFWLAARAEAGDGTKAHTTPVYVVREGLRFWKFSDLEDLFTRATRSLHEVETIVGEARAAVEAGEAAEKRAVSELARQGDALFKRAAEARKGYEELRQIAEAERARRGR